MSFLFHLLTVWFSSLFFSRPPAGTYSTGPLHGKLVDARGPRPSLIVAFFCLLVGYMGIKTIFDSGLKEGQDRASTPVIVLLIFCGFLTGTGGSSAASGSLNTVAKSFPEHLVSVYISCSYTDPSIVTHREPASQRWYYLGLDSQPSCSRQSHMPSSLGIHPTSSSFWQSALRFQ